MRGLRYTAQPSPTALATSPNLLLRAALCLCVALAPRTARGAEPEQLQAGIDAAIDRGVAFLLGEQNRDGSWGPVEGFRSEAHFDARVFALPGAERLAAYVRWRALQDCRRNSISMLAQSHFPPSRLHGVDSRSMLRLLADEKGVRWEQALRL